MKLIGIFLLVICLNFTANGYTKKINIKEKDASLDVVIKKLKDQTNYTFLYTKELIARANKVTIELVDVSLDEALEQIFLTQPLNYIIYTR